MRTRKLVGTTAHSAFRFYFCCFHAATRLIRAISNHNGNTIFKWQKTGSKYKWFYGILSVPKNKANTWATNSLGILIYVNAMHPPSTMRSQSKNGRLHLHTSDILKWTECSVASTAHPVFIRFVIHFESAFGSSGRPFVRLFLPPFCSSAKKEWTIFFSSLIQTFD